MWKFELGKLSGSKGPNYEHYPGLKGFVEYSAMFTQETAGRNLSLRGGYVSKIVSFRTHLYVAVDFNDDITDEDIKLERECQSAERKRLYITVDRYTVLFRRIREAAPEGWMIQEWMDALLDAMGSSSDVTEASIKKLFNITVIPNHGFKEGSGGRRFLIVEATNHTP